MNTFVFFELSRLNVLKCSGSPLQRSSVDEINQADEKMSKWASSLNVPFAKIERVQLDSVSRIVEPTRTTCVIYGDGLEGIVTRVALLALSDGLDVVILADLCVSDDPENSQIYLNRMTQFGAQISTFHQFSDEAEWLLAQGS
ncbi:MAG: hypothetical protein SXU28_04910 [Pseudomonadota bacterium]|nr:hypothetical protein [Pseudomonadota bacterium]